MAQADRRPYFRRNSSRGGLGARGGSKQTTTWRVEPADADHGAPGHGRAKVGLQLIP
jgi:hypothetical protein